ncbi:MAG: PEP-CTERM sorting domain-containing protein, partial [Candidatus Omnitrophota bacterium]
GNHKGYFVQAGGDFTYAGAMYLGDQVLGYVNATNPGTPSEGFYTMSGGTLTGGGLTLGEWGGVGRFTQSGGVVRVTDFDLGRQNDSSNGGPGQGYYYMYPAADPAYPHPELYVDNSNIGTRGIGVFEQNAGWHEVEGNMVLGVEAGSEGTYNLNGGSLTVGGTLTVKQTLSQPGAGTFNMAGGALTAGTIVNNDLFNVHDAGNLMSPLLIRGDIENNGEFRVTNAVVNFEGEFINNANFISNPSVMAFDNLEITSDGFIHAGLDEYHINGSFQNKSTKNMDGTEWFTRNAQLIFSPGSHEAMFNSQDLGALESAYNNNFAWGNVDFGGADFTLLAQGGDSWGALYTGTVGGLNIENGIIQNEFIGNSNIYYLAQYNPLLGGKSYDFVSGSGKFIPVNVVPEPISSALFLLGAGALAGVRRLRSRDAKFYVSTK